MSGVNSRLRSWPKCSRRQVAPLNDNMRRRWLASRQSWLVMHSTNDFLRTNDGTFAKRIVELEHQLRSFVPQTPQTSREQLLYQAGWEAALVQQAGNATATPRTAQAQPRRAANYYWAAACAALFLLSTALAWKVWQQPQSGVPTMITTAPATPPVSLPRASTTLTMQAPALEEPPRGAGKTLRLRWQITWSCANA